MGKNSFSGTEAKEDKFSKSSFPHSSPLHFLSSPSSHRSSNLKFHRIHQRSRSFSSLQDLKLGDDTSSLEVEDEDRMDMLWEDFNEELAGQTSPGGGKKTLDLSMGSSKFNWLRHGARELFCVKAAPHPRPGLMMILKVLKKLIFIQKPGEKRTASSRFGMQSAL